MLLFWLDISYILGMLIWICFLGAAFVWLLKRRRDSRQRSGRKSASPLSSVLLGGWTLFATLTLAEVVFALGVDHSEAFNASLIAKRWFLRHFDSERNSDGFRERRILSDRPPEGTQRLLFLGDSFTAGHGINRIEDRFSEQLESTLNINGKPKWQVYNMGEPGYEISMIRALEQAVLEGDKQVDIIVYCYMMNDIEGYDPKTQQAIDEIGQRRLSGNWLVEHSYFLNWMYHRWVQYSAGSSVDYFPHLVESYNGSPWNSVVHDLNDMVARSREKGIPFRLVIFPFMHNLGRNYPFRSAHEKLVAWAISQQVPVLDMMPIFEQHADKDLTVNVFDNHPNESAHAIIAHEVAKWLEEKTDQNLK